MRGLMRLRARQRENIDAGTDRNGLRKESTRPIRPTNGALFRT